MKIKRSNIKSIVAVALAAIISLQVLWLYNMYLSYRRSTANLIAFTLSQAIDYELISRHDQLGGPTSSSRTLLTVEKDTSTMREVKIVTEDTTIVRLYNAAYRHQENKANQFAFKYLIPLNIHTLDSIFTQLLMENQLPVKQTVIELYDRDRNDTIRTGCLVRTIGWQCYETETLFVDLVDSIGIKAYVQTPYAALFRLMLLQLILSAILIFSVVVCLFRLSQTIFRQYQAELIKKGFVDAMTHELKRPIGSSLFMLEYLQHHIRNNNLSLAGELLDDSVFALKKLNRYVEKIQEISRGEAGEMELMKESIPLLLFFTQLKEKYESLQDKNISIHLQIEKDILFVNDKVHFSNIMENLTENSIKYSGERVSIEIKAFQKDNTLYIIHRDNGWGISDSEVGRIFDKFYRGKSVEKRRKSGFGLGLSYVKIVVDQMGGTISVNSKEKQFTEFTLLLPI